MRRDGLFSALMFSLLLAIGATTGCSAPEYNDVEAFMKKPRPVASGKPYVIEPPDTIRIISPGAPEIHNIGQQIRPDGYITLYLLGDVFAAGKTPTQLSAEIEEKVLKYYEDAKVQIQVTGYNSKRYYVAGELNNTGPQQFTGHDTVLDAVLTARVPFTAWPEKAVIIRPSEEGELIKRMSVNLKDMWEKGDLSRNAILEEGDIVFVPINPLAAVGRVVQNLLLPVDPAVRAVSTPARAGRQVSTGGF